ncbi:RNA-binding protein Musashi homolog 2-like isoform X3 [Clytia hemisphaerica]|uniref:RRM domain-containing protein n=1 Tax=Clytia hemisphaerica TaxID=252671 RepID=A0A7M5X5I0_9CNID|eukprot:TCONS_00056954-protein
MAAPIQQISNGAIPIMSGVAGTPVQQPAVVYQQQQPMIVAGAAPMGYAPRKPYIRNPNEEHCKIFVGGVGKLTNDESLRAYFGKFGEIADSVIMKDKHTNEPRGFAFVTFKTPEAVSAVIEQNNKGGHTLDGKMFIEVRKFQRKSEYDPDKANTTLTTANGAAQLNFQYKGPMKCSPEMKVFVGGIGIGTTEDDVKKYFEQFGKVLAVDMPVHHVYKCPKGFAFVGFETFDVVAAVTKDRYHQINGKTVEVKGSDEQQAHLNKKKAEGMTIRYASAGRGRGIGSGNIGTVTGYGAYANLGQPLIVNPAQHSVQYTVPAAATGGYVYDPASNTYYQLPGTVVAGGAVAGAVQTVGTSVAAASPYAGATIAAGQQVLTSPQVGQRTLQATDMIQGLAAGSTVALGAAYPSETSTFGPTRHNVIGASAQQPMAGNTVADPHVVYSTATSISAGDAALSAARGYHPYGR